MATGKFEIDEWFLTPEEVAARYKVALSTLANQRSQGTGLPHVKIGGKVLYPASALAQAEAEGSRGITKETVARAVARVYGKDAASKAAELWKIIREEATAG